MSTKERSADTRDSSSSKACQGNAIHDQVPSHDDAKMLQDDPQGASICLKMVPKWIKMVGRQAKTSSQGQSFEMGEGNNVLDFFWDPKRETRERQKTSERQLNDVNIKLRMCRKRCVFPFEMNWGWHACRQRNVQQIQGTAVQARHVRAMQFMTRFPPTRMPRCSKMVPKEPQDVLTWSPSESRWSEDKPKYQPGAKASTWDRGTQLWISFRTPNGRPENPE